MANGRAVRNPRQAIRALMRHHLTGVIAGAMLALIVLAAVLAPWLAPGNPTDMQPMDRLKSPQEVGVMGTDVFGRDVLSRILYGARISLVVG
ncbi:MAG TPA: ABC transporter permease, partial [Thermomicrobiales bacterium]|nr:ABC transporter permease [Thermomicrobiales bacterium]